MTVYARKEICGYKIDDEVKVYSTRIDEERIYFLIWSKNLEMWVWVWAENFAPYPSWMQGPPEVEEK